MKITTKLKEKMDIEVKDFKSEIKENNQYQSYPKKNLIIRQVRVVDVKVNPQNRVRQEFGDFRKEPTYIGLKKSMIKFGLRNPISLNKNNELVEGFYRFCIAVELGWEKISAILDDLTEKEALELELEENFCRKDFNDYESYIGIARLKRLHEKDHPETKKGKYIRSSVKNQDHKLISASNALMVPSHNNNTNSFVETYHEILGVAKRTMYVKARIGEALLDNKFSSKTIEYLKRGKITQTQLLEELRKIENNQVIKKKLRNLSPVSTKPSEKNVKQRTDVGNTTLKIPHKETEHIDNKDKNKYVQILTEKEVSLTPSQEIQENLTLLQFEKPKIQKNEKLYNSISNNRIKETINKEYKQEEYCINCQKARAAPCFLCFGQNVVCLDDIEKGVFILRDPKSKKCNR